MRLILIVVFLQMGLGLSGQDHFVSFIDIENKPQIASQMMIHEEDFYLSSILGCGQEYRQCSGLLKVNITGDILDLIAIDNGFQFIGEFNTGRATSFASLSIDMDLNEIIDTLLLFHDTTYYYNYFATTSVQFNGNTCIAGTSFGKNGEPQVGHFFSTNRQLIDTSFIFNFANSGYSFATEMHKVHIKDEILIYFRYKNFDTSKDSIKIISLDTSFNQTFEWSKEIGRPHIPRGCATKDGHMIITVSNDTFNSTHDVWNLDVNGEVNWIYNWENEVKITNILRIEESNNGDLFVIGSLIDPSIYNDARYTAFVMRLDEYGNELWRRHFRNEIEHPGLSGYVSDLEELDNGDLILTGLSRRLLYEDGEERIDQDIFWARIGGDGCINGDCSEVYTITSTEDQLIDPIDQIDIYPNPIQNNTLNIEVKDGDTQVAMIYGLDGQLIKEAELTYGTNSITIETASSILMVRILDEFGQLIHSEKVLKL